MGEPNAAGGGGLQPKQGFSGSVSFGASAAAGRPSGLIIKRRRKETRRKCSFIIKGVNKKLK